MAHQVPLTLWLSLASVLFAAALANGQSSTASPNELNFRGADGASRDAITIDDGGKKQNQNVVPTGRPEASSTPSPTELVDPNRMNQDHDDSYDDDDDRQQQGDEFWPFQNFNQGFNMFDPLNLNNQQQQRGDQRRGPGSLLQELFGGRLIDNLRRHHQNFERQFSDLERKAEMGGEEVSYFNRNGVAYVRTCTTKRAS